MASPEWIADCMKWRGKVLTGNYQHWCWDWDELPVDDTCSEWPCGCFHEVSREIALKPLYEK